MELSTKAKDAIVYATAILSIFGLLGGAALGSANRQAPPIADAVQATPTPTKIEPSRVVIYVTKTAEAKRPEPKPELEAPENVKGAESQPLSELPRVEVPEGDPRPANSSSAIPTPTAIETPDVEQAEAVPTPDPVRLYPPPLKEVEGTTQ